MKYRLEAARVTADADAEMVVPRSLGLTRKTLQYEPLHNLYPFRCWIWYLRDQVSQREGPLRARWNRRGTLSNWDTNATGVRNITPCRDWLALLHPC